MYRALTEKFKLYKNSQKKIKQVFEKKQAASERLRRQSKRRSLSRFPKKSNNQDSELKKLKTKNSQLEEHLKTEREAHQNSKKKVEKLEKKVDRLDKNFDKWKETLTKEQDDERATWSKEKSLLAKRNHFLEHSKNLSLENEDNLKSRCRKLQIDLDDSRHELKKKTQEFSFLFRKVVKFLVRFAILILFKTFRVV